MKPTSLSQLRDLKRAELQALCKENSLKANGKTEVLIQSLADHLGLVGETSPQPTQSQKKTVVKPQRKGAASTTSSKKVVAQQKEGEEDGEGSVDEEFARLLVETEAERQQESRRIVSQSETIDNLSQIVDSLQKKLEKAEERTKRVEATMDDWQNAMNALEAKVNAMHENALAATEQDCLTGVRLAELGKHLNEVVQQLAQSNQVERSLAELNERVADDQETCDKRLERIEADITSLRQVAQQLQETPATTTKDAETPTTTLRSSTQVAFASPTPSDAPPTQTLVSFSSPAPSPAQVSRSTPRREGFVSSTSRKATPFKFGLPASTSSSSIGTPASAIPPHIMARPSTARSPRSSAASTTKSTSVAVQLESPAAPLPNASLGKRSRNSDASNLSVNLEAVVSPPRGSVAQVGISSKGTPAPRSAKKDDGHSRKKLRMSVADVEEQERDVFDSVENGKDEEETVNGNDDDDDDEESEHEDSSDSVRDYLMPTKTGDSPATTLKPTLIPTSDPAFFSMPVSPSRSTPGRRSTSVVNENVPTPSVFTSTPGRKSLPLASLPFPLVSPFAKQARPSTAFGTPATTALSNASNQHFTSLLKSTSKSNPRARSLSSPKKRTTLLPPPTPDAPRTLFGTERFPFSDGFDEESRAGEEESRFDDGFATAEEDNTETWSRFGGAFARV